MSDETALLAAIIANPGDDAARLVYADWLDEHDQHLKADFIRTQVRIAASNAADPNYPDLLEHYAEVIARFGSNPNLPLPELPPGFMHSNQDICLANFQRGFISSARGPWSSKQIPPSAKEVERFANGLQQLVTTTTARNLDLYALDPNQITRILNAPGAESLKSVLLAQAITALVTRDGDRMLQAVANSKAATNIDVMFLTFHVSMPTNTGFAALAKAKFNRLTQLGLWVQTGLQCDLKPLTEAKWFRNLRSVYFSDSRPLGSAIIPALATLPYLESLDLFQQSTLARKSFRTARGFPSLVRLQLMGRTPFDDAISMAKGRFPRLAELLIRGEGNANKAILRFCQARWWDQIRILELAGGWITDEPIVALAQSSIAPSLRILRLHHRSFGKAGLAAFADGKLFPNLTTLELDLSSGSQCTSAMVTKFAEQLSLPRLRHLSLWGYPLDGRGAAALAVNPAMANLTRLSLRNCGIGERELTAIVRSPHLQQLIELNVEKNKLKTATALQNSELLPQLAAARLEYNKITPAARQKLNKARKDVCNIDAKSR
jgi:uncharacterized protein (TIGR02996 family)